MPITESKVEYAEPFKSICESAAAAAAYLRDVMNGTLAPDERVETAVKLVETAMKLASLGPPRLPFSGTITY